MTNNNLDSSNNFELKEIKIKEKLYTLFYELTSEIKGTKIEIDEEEYEENIRTTTVFQIIEYIYQTIQILLPFQYTLQFYILKYLYVIYIEIVF